ncbi:molybdenum ABC transporter ATP-binding protein [Kordiimonas sp.]|uniref:molybdenum ABC transporter ATP-binding protein n=1 Tax=Kordiimonas sp. TaxID=1970157 RepID=UPI003A9551D9
MTTRMIKAQFSGQVGTFTVDASFEAPMKGVTALFGRSGSGKTTLLRAIAGLTRLKGSFYLGDTCWQDDSLGLFTPPHKRAVGYVFQEASLLPHLNVKQNLLFGVGRQSKLSQRKAPNPSNFKLDQVADLLNITALLERQPTTLSGGERQRIAIGRALLSQPELLLMDEPLAALDHTSKQDLMSYLERLHYELSLPMLYVSHDYTEVSRLADHAVVIADGKKRMSGPASEIFTALDFHPPEGRHETSVVIRAQVSGHDKENGLTKLAIGTQSINIPLSTADVGSELGVRIKASDVAVATKRPDFISIRNILEARITDIRDDKKTGLAELLLDVDGAAIRAQITHHAIRELGLEKNQMVFALVKSMSISDDKG